MLKSLQTASKWATTNHLTPYNTGWFNLWKPPTDKFLIQTSILSWNCKTDQEEDRWNFHMLFRKQVKEEEKSNLKIKKSSKTEKTPWSGIKILPNKTISASTNGSQRRNILSRNLKQVTIDVILHISAAMGENPFNLALTRRTRVFSSHFWNWKKTQKRFRRKQQLGRFVFVNECYILGSIGREMTKWGYLKR